MSLVACRECGAQVSVRADKCPNCGSNSFSKITLVTNIIIDILKIVPILIIAYFLVDRFFFTDSPPQSLVEPKSTEAKTVYQPIISIPSIAMRDQPTVEKIIGSAASCENIKYGRKCNYRNHGFNIDVVFINGKADWIAVNNLRDVAYSPEAITSLGFKQEWPTFRNEHTIRWENTQDMLSIQIAPGEGGRISLAYIKATTP